MIRSLKLLQANLNKSENVQSALHNDEALKDITAILVQETNNFISGEMVVIPGARIHWVCFVWPPQPKNRWPVKSCIGEREDLSAVQLPVSCADITAVVLAFVKRKILVASVYILPTHAEGISPSQSQEHCVLACVC